VSARVEGPNGAARGGTRRAAGRLCAAAALLLSGVRASAARYEIRWVLIHEPSAAVEETARDFKARVEKETNGDVRVVTLTRSEYKERYNGGRPVSQSGVIRAVASGKLEMFETYTGMLGSAFHSLWVLGIPYLFQNYGEADAAIGSPVGRELLDGLLGASVRRGGGLRGLAFSYSGYAVLAMTDRGARSPKGFGGLRIQVMGNPVSMAIARKLGAEPVVVPAEGFAPLVQNDLVDGIETTFADFDAAGFSRSSKVIVDTEHCLFTEIIVINEKFFKSLPEPDQAAVLRAAAEAAKAERLRRVQANADARRSLEKQGIKIIDLTAAERDEFQESLALIYGDVGALLGIEGQDVIEAIRTVTGARAPAGP
jgi:TRAP-type C4-dicarboxylate transport system substrate-binding protein